VDDLSAVARELRAARDNLGLTREQLAEKSGYSVSSIEKVELGMQPATDEYVAAVLPVLGDGVDVPALFGRLRHDALRRPVVSEWLRDWLHVEQQADMIRWYELSLIPGLLQTEGYARALLGDDDRVAARLARQEILTRDAPTELIAIVDESALRYLVGSPRVMAQQLTALADTKVIVYVLPTDANAHHLGRDGSFVIATVGERQYGYVATPARGFTVDDREIVSGLQRRWEALLAVALPQGLSRGLITKVAEQWSNGE